MKIIFKKELFEKMKNHAVKESPNESCGIIAGTGEIAQKIYEMANTSQNPQTCYFMAPKEQLKIFKEMRKEGLELLGIYHSHINLPAYPSKRDVDLANYPDAFYVIIRVDEKEVKEIRAFKIMEGKIEEAEIYVEE
jgi:proteasome lid subunit RPN8/RPN11